VAPLNAALPPDGMRTEIKFPLSRAGFLEVERWLRASGLLFRPAHPDRIVQNIYFDNHDAQSYFESVDGQLNREKVRIRWYGKGSTPPAFVFEVKKKRGAHGHKIQIKLANDEDLLALWESRRLAPYLRTVRRDEMGLFLNRYPVPHLYNRYRRAYFVTPEGLRMTIDQDLAFRTLRGSWAVEREAVKTGPHCVIEFKAVGEHAARTRDMLSTFPFARSKYSKYVAGLEGAV
jgi:hypothetical protein